LTPEVINKFCEKKPRKINKIVWPKNSAGHNEL